MYLVHVRHMYEVGLHVTHMYKIYVRCFKHAENNVHVRRAGYSEHTTYMYGVS